ncbi:hypothetical protein, partial [Cronobacter malonaticus]|uniref:hypothetical protein n=1 Tax=Cronobacter malonaticus TaxID=413503 RepID=UPI001A95EAB4
LGGVLGGARCLPALQLLNAGVAGALRLPASYNRSSTQTANKKAAPEGGFYAGVLLSFYAVLVRIR